MSKFTEQDCFIFDGGVKVWREDGDIRVHYVPHDITLPQFVARGDARAVHAFIEAERTGWRYTNADKTEARNGRWVVHATGDYLRLTHDEAGELAIDLGESGENKTPEAGLRMAEFRKWRREQSQPEEPTGLGAVVESRGDTWVRARHSDVRPAWTRPTDGYTAGWFFISSAPVTVLSKGVQS